MRRKHCRLVAAQTQNARLVADFSNLYIYIYLLFLLIIKSKTAEMGQKEIKINVAVAHRWDRKLCPGQPRPATNYMHCESTFVTDQDTRSYETLKCDSFGKKKNMWLEGDLLILEYNYVCTSFIFHSTIE